MGSKRAPLRVRLTADPDITHTVLVLYAYRLWGLQGHGGNQDNRIQTRPQIRGVRTEDAEGSGGLLIQSIICDKTLMLSNGVRKDSPKNSAATAS